jgi:hypothetical protein
MAESSECGIAGAKHAISWGTDVKGVIKVSHAEIVADIAPATGSIVGGFCEALNAPPLQVAEFAGTWWSPNVWKKCEIPTAQEQIAAGKMTQEQYEAYRSAYKAWTKDKSKPPPAKPCEWCNKEKRTPHRREDHWMSASGIALDFDWTDKSVVGKAAHKKLPEGVVKWAIASEGKPGNIVHTTPRGIRLIYVLDQPCADLAMFKAAVAGALADGQRWLETTEWKHVPDEEDGLTLDSSARDPSRLLWAPTVIAGPKVREAKAWIVNEQPYTVEQLAAMKPANKPEAAPKAKAAARSSGAGLDKENASKIDSAVAEFNADHRVQYGTYPASGTCPVCKGEGGGWGALPKDPTRWYCWHAGHLDRAGGVVIGNKKEDDSPGYYGDALDLYIWDYYGGRKSSQDRVWVLTQTPKPDGKSVYLPESSLVDFKDHDPSRWVFDMSANGYRFRKDSGDLDPAVTEAAFNKAHQDLGKTSLAAFKRAIKTIHREEMVLGCDDPVTEHNGRSVLNLFRPTLVIPHENTAYVDEWLKVVDNLTGGDVAAYEYFLDWHALPLQTLVREKRVTRMLTGLVLTHPLEGTGKGTWETGMTSIYNPRHVVNIGQDQIEDKYNGYLKNCLYLVLNEIQSDRQHAKATANKLKPMVTDAIVPLREMYRENAPLVATWNVSAASNMDAIYMTKHDRRWVVMGAKGILDPVLGKTLAEDARANGPMVQALYHYLLNRTVKAQPGRNSMPQTLAKQQLVELTASSEEKFLAEIEEVGLIALTNSFHGCSDNAADPFPDGWVSRRELNRIYADWCRDTRVQAVQEKKLTQAVKSHAGVIEKWRGSERGWIGLKIVVPEVKAAA